MAPRLIPGFHAGLRWLDGKPQFSTPPEVIITTGRQAAAVGKYVCQRYRQQQQTISHIQILNPKDNPANYQWLLLPKHDGRQGDNIIPFTGSIHPYDAAWFEQKSSGRSPQAGPIAVLLGHPAKAYFKQQLVTDLKQIKAAHDRQPLLICGSPRLPDNEQKRIKQWLQSGDRSWFNANDGDNPYQTILSSAQHIYVTADSINMMNECAASNAQVSLLAEQWVQSQKHQRFIQSLAARWSAIGTTQAEFSKPMHAIAEVWQDPRFQNWLNSPFSSNTG